MKRVLVGYEARLYDVIDLVELFEGYFDADLRVAVFTFNLDLVEHEARFEWLIEELENRGIAFKIDEGGDIACCPLR